MSFDTDRSTFAGTSGCNDLSGRFDTVGTSNRLTLTSAKSLQICRVDQSTERGVRSVLNDTRAYRASPATLELLDESGKLIAKLAR